MKQFTFFILMILLSFQFTSFANPIIIYPVVSEIFFDEDDNWQIEITNYYNYSIDRDTIIIESLSGIAKVRPFITEENQFYIITLDSLITPLSINKNYDFIKVYFQDPTFVDTIYLGDYPNSNIHNLQEGYSIARYLLDYDYDYSEQFYKCSSPTLGYENDVNNMQGFISGNIYDNNQLLTSGKIYFDDYYLTIHDDGINANIFSRSYNEIKYHNQLLEVAYFTINPGETLFHDIYFSSVSVNEVDKNNITFSIFPNPSESDFKFYFKTNFLIEKVLFIEINDIQGKMIDKIILDNTKEDFIPYNKIKPGIYVCTLRTEGEILRSVNLIVK